ASRAEDNLSGGRLDDLFPDEEARLSGNDDEGLVIGMDVQSRAFSGRIIPIGEYGDWPIVAFTCKRSTPGAGGRGIKERSLRGGPPVRHHGRWIKVASCHGSPPQCG